MLAGGLCRVSSGHGGVQVLVRVSLNILCLPITSRKFHA